MCADDQQSVTNDVQTFLYQVEKPISIVMPVMEEKEGISGPGGDSDPTKFEPNFIH